MKFLLFLTLISSPVFALQIEETISGKVLSTKGCSSKVMVWLSLDKNEYKERLLLMHTEVPVGGTFRFYVKPGDYQVRASDKEGCEFFQKVKVRGEEYDVPIQMVKK